MATTLPSVGTFYYIVSKKSGTYIGVANGSLVDKANIQQSTSNQTDAEQWQFLEAGNGYFYIVNKKSNKYMEVAGGSLADEANIQQYVGNQTDAQKWKLLDVGDGYFCIVNKKSGKYVDLAAGGNILQYAGHKADHQRWRFEVAKLSPPDATDVMIKDAPNDSGVEPFTGANFWGLSDIVVRPNDDGVFEPNNAAKSSKVERGQPNYIYVRVTNKGSQDARNVTVSTRITPAVGLEFVYPQDWTLVDGKHVSPEPITANFASIPAGGTAMAKFRIEAAQTETLYGWTKGTKWHPCLLAMVNADNDYAFANAQLTKHRPSARFNNLAQRNLSVIDVQVNTSVNFPVIAGNEYDPEPRMSITIDRSRLPETMPLQLALDDDGSAFPLVNFEAQPTNNNEQQNEGDDNGLIFLERTRVSVRLGGCRGVLTVEKGSRFDCLKPNKLGNVTVKGGELVVEGDKRYVKVKESVATVEIEKSPNNIYPLSVQTTIPATAKKGDEFSIDVAQQNSEGTTVGGASVVYVVGG